MYMYNYMQYREVYMCLFKNVQGAPITLQYYQCRLAESYKWSQSIHVLIN